MRAMLQGPEIDYRVPNTAIDAVTVDRGLTCVGHGRSMDNHAVSKRSGIFLRKCLTVDGNVRPDVALRSNILRGTAEDVMFDVGAGHDHLAARPEAGRINGKDELDTTR